MTDRMKPTDQHILLPRDEWAKRANDGALAPNIGMVKIATVDITKGPLDPDTGMHDIDATISTAAVDRDHDIIDQGGWDLEHYRRNPVVLWAHDHKQPPVARSVDIGLSDNGNLTSRDRFTPRDVYDFGAMIYRMVKGGFIRAKSVGFAPVEWTFNEERHGYDLLKTELWEHSWVPVPSNPEALIQASAAGIDLQPMREWAAKILDNDPDESRVLCWLPRHVVENAWKQTGYVGGSETKIITSQDVTVFNTDADADADASDSVSVPQHGEHEAPATEHQLEGSDMDEKILEALTSLTETVKANIEQVQKLIDMMVEQKEADDSIELSELLGSVVGELEAQRSGRLPEGRE